MKKILCLLIFLVPLFCLAQVSVKSDSVGLYIVSVNTEVSGREVTVKSEALDSNAVKDRLFNVTLETYSAVARAEAELIILRAQANQLRIQLLPNFDTLNYFTKTRNLYSARMYGKYTYRQNNVLKNIELSANAAGNLVVKEGSKTGTIRIYAPDYIEIRGFFQTGTPPANVDVFFAKSGAVWKSEIDGKPIILKRK